MIIAIDPDVHESGIALLDSPYDIADVELGNMTLIEVFEAIRSAEIVVIEAGWLNGRSLSFLPGRKRAIDVGRNHAIGQQIENACTAIDLDYILVRPKSHKWTHEEFVRLTGSQIKRSNQDQRDAARALMESSAIPMMRGEDRGRG